MEDSKKTQPVQKLTKEGETTSKEEKPLEKADEKELETRKILNIKRPAESKPENDDGKNTDKNKKENEGKTVLPFTFTAPSKPLFGDLFKKTEEETAKPFNLPSKPSTEGSADQKPGAFILFPNVSGNTLFGAAQPKETGQKGIFGDFYASGNLFGKSSNGGDKKNSDEGSGDEEGGDYHQEKSEDEETVKQRVKDPYKYETFYDTLIRKEVANFKVDDSDSFGPGSVAIEQSRENKEVIKFIMRNKTKNIIFNCVLVKNLSHCVFIKNKPGISFFGFCKNAEPEKKAGENKPDEPQNAEKNNSEKPADAEKEADKPKTDAKQETDDKTKQKPTKMIKKNVKVLFNSEDDAKLFKEQIDKI